MVVKKHNVRALVRQAANDDKIILTEHVRQRMWQRGIRFQQIKHVLIHGNEIDVQLPHKSGQNPLSKLTGEAAGEFVTVVASVK